MNSEKAPEKRSRLRNGQQIVGYARHINDSVYYSKDTFWWTGMPISYEIEDHGIGFKDKNDRQLYENDIIKLRFYDPFRRSEIYRIRSYRGAFVLTKLEKEINEPLLLLNRAKSIEWISYTFINLESIFGVSEQ